MKTKELPSPTFLLAEKSVDADDLKRQYQSITPSAFENSTTFNSFTSAFRHNGSATNKAIDTVALISFGGAATSVIVKSLFTHEPAFSAPDPNVQAVVTTVTDTVPLLTTITMIVFSAGLGPWAARTCLSWLGSIMRGSV